MLLFAVGIKVYSTAVGVDCWRAHAAATVAMDADRCSSEIVLSLRVKSLAHGPGWGLCSPKNLGMLPGLDL